MNHGKNAIFLYIFSIVFTSYLLYFQCVVKMLEPKKGEAFMKNKYAPTDMGKKPRKPSWYLKLVEYGLMIFYSSSTKITKHGDFNFKEPTLVICNHASFTDFGNINKLMFPKIPNYVTSIDEFLGMEWLMRHIGCFPKRKFTNDFFTPRHFNTVINKNKNSIVLFPEVRFSFCGVDERIDKGIGKLAKMLRCQVVLIHQKGNFLKSPQWNKRPYRKVKNYVDAYLIASKEDTYKLPADEIQKRIEDLFSYDEYKWQRDEKIKITSKVRAKNIDRILYKCPNCGVEGEMSSTGTSITCNDCHTTWEMDEYGLLHQDNGEARFPLVSDWYRWQREEVYNEVNSNKFVFEDEVVVKRFVNCKVGLKTLGKAMFRQDDNGIHVEGIMDNGEKFEMHKSPESTTSLHVEFDYRKQGAAIDFNTVTDTWFLFPVNKSKSIIKLNFSTEALYDKHYK